MAQEDHGICDLRNGARVVYVRHDLLDERAIEPSSGDGAAPEEMEENVDGIRDLELPVPVHVSTEEAEFRPDRILPDTERIQDFLFRGDSPDRESCRADLQFESVVCCDEPCREAVVC